MDYDSFRCNLSHTHARTHARTHAHTLCRDCQRCESMKLPHAKGGVWWWWWWDGCIKLCSHAMSVLMDTKSVCVLVCVCACLSICLVSVCLSLSLSPASLYPLSLSKLPPPLLNHSPGLSTVCSLCISLCLSLCAPEPPLSLNYPPPPPHLRPSYHSPGLSTGFSVCFYVPPPPPPPFLFVCSSNLPSPTFLTCVSRLSLSLSPSLSLCHHLSLSLSLPLSLSLSQPPPSDTQPPHLHVSQDRATSKHRSCCRPLVLSCQPARV